MANSTCHFKREINPPPILPKCRYNLDCHDYTREHRFGFYHDTFDYHHRERMNFLLKASKYSLSKKRHDSNFSGKYLWDQFSIDLKNNTYHDFLVYTYMYLIHLEKVDDIDLMSIKQAVTTLEENGVTGIYYLNVAFMMWLFNMDHLVELNEFLEDSIENKIIQTKYDIHFGNLLKLMATRPNRIQLEAIDQTKLKKVYSEFMLGNKYKTTGEQIDVFAVEKEILTFQMSILEEKDSFTISNTQLDYIIKKKLPKSKPIITGHLF
jgi:hypothetical protein